MSTEEKREALRIFVRGAYDVQKIRIQMGNRIAAQFRSKLGQSPGTKLECKEADKLLKELHEEYKCLTDGIAETEVPDNFEGQRLISNTTEFILTQEYIRLRKCEEKHFDGLRNLLEDFSIWTDYLKPEVKGCGPIMAGVIISEINIRKAKYVSSIWKYSGLDVAEDGRARGRYKEHLRDIEYTDKEGKKATKKGLTYNPFLRTKLLGVLAPCFVRRKEGEYRIIYDNYKNRIATDPRFKDHSKLHIHNMALRYMIKRFIANLYVKWKELEGLPAMPEYHEAKQGHKHSA